MILQTHPDRYECSKPKLIIISFDCIFELVVINVINTVFNIYGNVIPVSKLDKDVKRIFIHYLLEQIYKRMILETNRNVILYINTSFTTKSNELWEYIEKEKLKRFILKECKSISNNSPLPIYVEDNDIDLTDNSGETREAINKLYQTLKTFKQKVTSLRKLRKYSKDNGLLRFMDDYHHKKHYKNNMFYHKYLKGI